ncbi:MAG: GntP family permease [Prolixibacteraceae bacterium]|nr:GntP family permease [Prolixibacteraceae bacterium]MBN2774634.1 GntP family permease [Prolixibacteraceae bacterium]
MVTLLIFIFTIVFIVVTCTRFKVHPFLSLLLAAFLFGLLSGMPLNGILESINAGFGGTIGNIGIIIVAGIVIGAFLENSGGAKTLANSVLKLVGKKKVHTAMGLIGFIVSIPVFADSGFVILSSLNRALTKKAKLSLAGTAVALSLGLTASHTMVPPTPGPIAAAGILNADLGLVILIGMITSLVALIVAIVYSKFIGKKVFIDPNEDKETVDKMVNLNYQPSLIKSILPILIPIVLIVLRSVAEYPTNPFGEGQLKTLLTFFGNPVTALFIGVLISFLLPEKFNKEMLSTSGWVGDALKTAAIIILITGAGGAFGKVLQNSDFAAVFSENLRITGLGLWLPFILAFTLKTAQGSSTVALITAASIVAPLLSVMGLDSEMSKAMVVIAIGAGAAFFSHANDSFFWVVTQMSSMDINKGYRTHSIGTFVVGVSAMLFLTILNLFI